MKMLMTLMPFDKAKVIARYNGHAVKPMSILGIKRDDIPWGKEVTVEANDLSEKYYTFKHYIVPSCCFEANVTPLDADYVLHYGTIITDDEVFDRCDEMAAFIRIRIVSCQGKIYYIKMVNGEVEDFRRITI